MSVWVYYLYSHKGHLAELLLWANQDNVNVVKAVSKVGRFSDVACSLMTCLVVGMFMLKTA